MKHVISSESQNYDASFRISLPLILPETALKGPPKVDADLSRPKPTITDHWQPLADISRPILNNADQ